MQKTVALPGKASTSKARSNRSEKKIMLWDQEKTVHYDILKLLETVNGDHYWQQLDNLNHALLKKISEWYTRYERVILHYGNASFHRPSTVQDTIKTPK